MRAKIIIVGMGLLCLLPSRWAKAELFNDGGVHNIGSGSYGDVVVDDPAPASGFTTVYWGGTAYAESLATFNSSRVTVDTLQWGVHLEIGAHDNSRVTISRGGAEVSVVAYDNSRVVIDGGWPSWGLLAHDDSRVIVNGGNYDYFFADGNSHVTVNDGRGWGWGFYVAGNSQVTLNGGYVYDVQVVGNGLLTMNGGQVDALDVFGRATVTGGNPGTVWTPGQGFAKIVGSDFQLYGDDRRTQLLFSGYGELTADILSPDGIGWLWGKWANGDPVECLPLFIEGDGQISLVPVPGAALLGVIGLLCSGWRLRRRTS